MDYNRPDLKLARKRTNGNTLEIEYSLDDKYKNIGNGKIYNVITFGCQGNEADSEVMSGILEQMGFTNGPKENADVLIINTCAIRENAEDRFYGTIGGLKALKQKKKDMIICICGCMPQEEKTITKILDKYPQIDVVFGTHNIHMLPEYIYRAQKSTDRLIEVYSTEGNIVEKLPHIRLSKKKAWVNIMFGCDEFCTYCIVPYTRGKERSRRPKDIIDEVKGLVEDGYLEITLLGQNVNAYGKDFKDMNYTFSNLLLDLSDTGIERIRYTTSHPRDLDIETMKAMQRPNIMPHLHLPVQSGSNTILKRMNRKYTHEEYLEKINKLKELNPGISITTDIIVAFPGETEEDFNETLRLCDEVDFEGAFTFIYSPREGTPAATYKDQIDEATAHKRLDLLHDKINAGYLKGNKRFEGKVVKVLVDGTSKNDENILCGYSEHNKLVNFKGNKNHIGTIVNVKITEAKTWFLIGEEVE
ncbi:MAG: tRNA (N6-isopentenyl adenosine(37)-C2)-methylthiotransferase MiaB [bacterium]|nr:tRNA (N6-isopentenyl adenosine(37)-C2)-methylthiotransferase MiaB [bacterium]